jgi:hypothetical protein
MLFFERIPIFSGTAFIADITQQLFNALAILFG